MTASVGGPGATPRATAQALARVGAARTVVLVEGVSDQLAVETAATALHRDLDAEGVVILPIGGAHGVRRFAPGFGRDVRLLALCDRREEEIVRRGLLLAQVEPVGVHVCVEDLEDELIRTLGTDAVRAVLEAQGDLAAFRSLQSQPAWRGREVDAQMRRFLGSGARRKIRYAGLLVEAAAVGPGLPAPLSALLTAM